MPTPDWASKEQRRENDNRRTFWRLQSELLGQRAYGVFGGLLSVLGLALGLGGAFAVTAGIPDLDLVSAGALILVALGLILAALAMSARWRRGVVTRHLALPALLAFGGFTIAIVLGISR